MNAIRERLHPGQVGWLLLALTLVMLPHAERLPWWITLLSALLLGWRAFITWHALRMPSKWLLFTIAGGAVGGIYLHYGRLLGRDSGVTLLVVMLALKLLEMVALRDAMILVFLCYFVVITNFLYSQSISMAAYLLLVVWVITATLIGFQFRQQQPGYRYQFRSAGVLLMQSLPLMLVLFVLFPRISGPLWSMPQDALSGTTGLSDEMAPGSVSKLLSSDAIALRASFRSAIPRPNQLYWRGPVMWDFDGYTWKASRFASQAPHEVERLGAMIDYTVTVEPHSRRWLFALDLPAAAPEPTRLTSDFQLLNTGAVERRTRYNMISYPEWRDNRELSPGERRRGLALPAASNPRTTAMAAELRQKTTDDDAFINGVLSLFREQNFYYTTTPPLLGANPVDQFLFSTRAGFCEHYASAFTVLMRAGGIPARIVTGYQGGEINYVGAYLTVRQADAHAWAEVWLNGRGWTRVDPTASVSPSRVEAGVAAAVPQSELLPRQLRGEYEWLQRARMTWDSVTNSWNQVVLEYTQERQLQLMERLGVDDVSWQKLASLMFILATSVTLVVGVLMLYRLRGRRTDPLIKAYARFCDKLARHGVPRYPSEGPQDYAKRAGARLPDLQPQIEPLIARYIDLRYGDCAVIEASAVSAWVTSVKNFPSRPKR